MGDNNHIIGIGELAASAKPEAVLKTFGLGSCVALILYDPRTTVGGMVHIALPDSSISNRGRSNDEAPGYYADKGVEHLLRHIGRLRGNPFATGLSAALIGGASVLPNSSRFFIGQRNVQAVRTLLSNRGIPIRLQDVGLELSRTVFFEVGEGKITVVSPGRKHIVMSMRNGGGVLYDR
ncbi:chemotaxis protein CheD [Desulfovibrio mangrovi]|uniref:chemotaxis protein CheD n=1 Tax=Desulfovibrio mangrovi TaxID=2976983 RepID=UPI0022452165|nr:chemotaxis protein CheD [Desulfovibrio mangrovi]UZP69074.1 chemotaxis protein CheD [Desulfovibrio mangrovi]